MVSVFLSAVNASPSGCDWLLSFILKPLNGLITHRMENNPSLDLTSSPLQNPQNCSHKRRCITCTYKHKVVWCYLTGICLRLHFSFLSKWVSESFHLLALIRLPSLMFPEQSSTLTCVCWLLFLTFYGIWRSSIAFNVWCLSEKALVSFRNAGSSALSGCDSDSISAFKHIC